MLYARSGFEMFSKTAVAAVNVLKVANRVVWLTAFLTIIPVVVPGQSLSVSTTEYRIPNTSDSAFGITTGPDGALWFTEALDNKIGRISTAGVFTEYPVPNLNGRTAGPSSITSGPDGALWFTVTFGIGRITTSGLITEFSLGSGAVGTPNSGSGNGDPTITSGPDGALWFLDQLNFAVGRITTTGVFSEFKLPNPCTFGPPLRGIISGPDAALWFGDLCNGSIGRITTGGTITEYVIPSLKSDPLHHVTDNITVGPDGALWFSETNQSIGRITTGGIVTEYPVGYDTFGITKGPDGAIWFTTAGYSLIGRITTSGVVTTYSANPGSQITLGPDGALWYIGFSANDNRITRVQVPARTGVLSHIAAGGGWNTTITLVNTSSTSVSARLAFHSDDGTALSLPMNVTQQGSSQAVTGSTLDRTINANSTLLIDTGAQLTSTVVGWADVTGSGPLGGFAIFRQTPQTGSPSEGTVPLQSQFPSTISLAYDNTAGFVIGVALANLSASSANITATIWDDSGNQLGTQNITIAGSGHTAFVLPTQLTLTAGKRGIVQFKTPDTEGITGLGLRFSPFGTFTSVPTILQ